MGMNTTTPIAKREKSKKNSEAPLSAANLAKFGTNANMKYDNNARNIPVSICPFVVFTSFSNELFLPIANRNANPIFLHIPYCTCVGLPSGVFREISYSSSLTQSVGANCLSLLSMNSMSTRHKS